MKHYLLAGSPRKSSVVSTFAYSCPPRDTYTPFNGVQVAHLFFSFLFLIYSIYGVMSDFLFQSLSRLMNILAVPYFNHGFLAFTFNIILHYAHTGDANKNGEFPPSTFLVCLVSLTSCTPSPRYLSSYFVEISRVVYAN